ncbi:prepilin-type N-terminal cleavage/methylation domain-containing protein [Lentisphaera profundi]|uniref:Prepilin-type N-terminal cleavage/methylation domain-containing protein n=1 Tax=Lentisphaera profundi TaxID=1658616 RepID=A0ABY7VRT7_9BACT|nr:prepilin-type N-terminal cleavage/methylation domain-containing protein [Lentisphaera profundi]WDE96918.1 prepilin-type N-terminal cleavage/methylation domain-containing protein [Lentisphaera profundi]
MHKKNIFKNFSLIELLVVIAIIGILASLLLPMLSKSRKTAQQAVCLNKIKQYSISSLIYADDFDNMVPHSTANTLAPWDQWYDRLKVTGYISDVDNLNNLSCPSSTPITNHWSSGFGPNSKIGWRSNSDEPVAITSSHPSETVLMMDTLNNGNFSYTAYYQTNSASLFTADSSIRINRHNNKANTSFLDGHAQALSSSYLTANSTWGSTLWNP